jgi:hypothetical protein
VNGDEGRKPVDDLAEAFSKGGEALADWYLQRSRQELLGYADLLESSSKRPELSLQAPGLLLAAKMLRDAAAEEPCG